MTPLEWITFAQMLIKFGAEAANAWADALDRAREGKPVSPEERKAVCAKISYHAEVPNSLLP